MVAPDPDPDLKLEQIAAALQIPLQSAWKLRRLGRFPNAYNVGSDRCPKWRVPRTDLDNFKKDRRAA